MITLRTRSTTKDFDVFFGQSDFSWNKYDSLRAQNPEFCIFVETTKVDWRIYFSKIPSNRKTHMGQAIYAELAGKGQKGDKDARFFYNLIAHALSNPFKIKEAISEIKEKFDAIFDSAFIDSLDDKRCTSETEQFINSKMQEFFKGFENQEAMEYSNGQKANTLYVDCLTNSTKDAFLKKLSCICDRNVKDEVVLVCTFSPLSYDGINDFCKQFSGKNMAVSILVENANGAKGMKLPYNADIASSVLDSGGKKKLLKTWLYHLLTEFLMLSLIVIGRICFYKKQEKLTLQIEEFQNKEVLQGTWTSNDASTPVTLIIQGDSFTLIGQTNYAIVGDVAKSDGMLNATGQMHNLEQLAKEQDSEIDRLKIQYSRKFKPTAKYIEITDSDKKTLKLYKRNNNRNENR